MWRTRRRTGERSYNLYTDSELTWEGVASHLGYNSKQAAYSAARNHAKRTGQAWPPMRSQMAARKLRQEQRDCYDMHERGMSWAEIASATRSVPATCLSRAHRFAVDNDLPWPVRPQRKAS